MLKKHCLNQKELARRWGISHRTLERWRYAGLGPVYLKLGGRVLYRQSDIDAYEQTQLSRALIVSNGGDAAQHTAPRRLTAKPPAHLGATISTQTGSHPAMLRRPQQ